MVNNEIVWRIAQHIRRIRLRKKVTIQQLAEKTNVSKGLLSKIENSRTVPSLPVFIAILTSLEIPLTDFFESMALEHERAYAVMPKSQPADTAQEPGTGFN